MLNIESESMYDDLANFLGTDTRIEPQIKNQNGHGTLAGSMLRALELEVPASESTQKVDTFFSTYGIGQQASCLTHFEDSRFNLSISIADRVTQVLPGLRPTVRSLFGFFLRRRAQATSYFAKWFCDTLIGLLRSEQDLHYYTSIHRFGSGSR